MKKTIITTTTVGMAAFGLTMLPAMAVDVAAPEKPATEAVATDTTTIYIVQVSGKG